MTIVKKYQGHTVPEGATHFDPAHGLYKDAFAKRDGSGSWIWWLAHGDYCWGGAGGGSINIIELPQEPETFVPVVGEECEWKIGCLCRKGTYVGINSRGSYVVEIDGEYKGYHKHQIEFRLIKTDREKTHDAALKVLNNMGDDVADCWGAMMLELYDAGMLVMPEGK